MFAMRKKSTPKRPTKKPAKNRYPYRCEKLAEYCSARGELSRLAESVGVGLPIMSLWVSGARRIPVERCLAISRETSGYVQPNEMRADVNWST